MQDLAKVAWDAYAKAVGGTTFDGKGLPEWDDLGERQKQGWDAAAQAVLGTSE